MTNAGTISVAFAGDTSRLDAAFAKTRASLGGVNKVTERTRTLLGMTSASADALGASMQHAGSAGATGLGKLTPAAERAEAKIRQLGATTERVSFKDSFAGLAPQIAMVTAAMTTLVGLYRQAAKHVNEMSAEAAFTRMGGNAAALSASLSGMVDEGDAIQVAILATGLGLTADQAERLGGVSRDLARVVGTDTRSAFESLATAVTTGREKELQAIGVKVDFKKAEDAFAKSLGVTTDRLSEQGVIQAHMIELEKRLAPLRDGAATDQARMADAFEQSGKSMNTFFGDMEDRGTVVFARFASSVGSVFDVLGRVVVVFDAVAAAWPTLSPAAQGWLDFFMKIADAAQRLVKALSNPVLAGMELLKGFSAATGVSPMDALAKVETKLGITTTSPTPPARTDEWADWNGQSTGPSLKPAVVADDGVGLNWFSKKQDYDPRSSSFDSKFKSKMQEQQQAELLRAQIVTDSVMLEVKDRELEAGLARAAFDRTKEALELKQKTALEEANILKERQQGGIDMIVNASLNGTMSPEVLGSAIGMAAAGPMGASVGQAIAAQVMQLGTAIMAGFNTVTDRILASSQGGKAVKEGGAVAMAGGTAAATIAAGLFGTVFFPLLPLFAVAAPAALLASSLLVASTYTARFEKFVEVAGVGLDRLIQPLNQIWVTLFPLSGLFVKFGLAMDPVMRALLDLVNIETVGKVLFTGLGMIAQAVLYTSSVIASAASGLLWLITQIPGMGDWFQNERAALTRFAKAAWEAGDDMHKFTWEHSKELAASTIRATNAISEFGAELTNIPTGYRVPYYEAEAPDGRGNNGGAPGAPPGGGNTNFYGPVTFTMSDEGIAAAARREIFKKMGKLQHMPARSSPDRTG